MIEKAVPRKAIRIFMNISAPTSCKEKLITTDKLYKINTQIELEYVYLNSRTNRF